MAKARKTEINRLVGAIPLVDAFERSLKIINTRSSIGVKTEEERVWVVERKEKLDPIQLLRAVFLVKLNARIDYDIDCGIYTSMLISMRDHELTERPEPPKELDTIGKIEWTNKRVEENIRRLRRNLKTESATVMDSIEIIGSRANVEKIEESIRRIKNGCILNTMMMSSLADILSLEDIDLLMSFYTDNIREYVDLKKKWKYEKGDKRRELIRKIRDKYYKEAVEAGEKDRKLGRGYVPYTPLEGMKERAWIEFEGEEEEVERTPKQEIEFVKVNMPKLLEVFEKEEKDIRDLVDMNVPIGFIDDCLAEGIDPNDILDHYLKPLKEKRIYVLTPEKKEEKDEVGEEVEKIFEKLTNGFTEEYQEMILKHCSKEIKAAIREYVEYLGKKEGTRGPFAPNGIMETAPFEEKFKPFSIPTDWDGWKLFSMQFGRNRIVIAVKPEKNEIGIIGIYENHETYSSAVARFKENDLEKIVVIE